MGVRLDQRLLLQCYLVRQLSFRLEQSGEIDFSGNVKVRIEVVSTLIPLAGYTSLRKQRLSRGLGLVACGVWIGIS